MRIRPSPPPGHTFTHLSYVLEIARQPPAVFTGVSLLYGSTGRPDLMGAARAAELAHAQYALAHRLAADLPEDADVYPTHGFGSFCAASQSGGVSSTIDRERRVNPVLTLDEQLYVNELLDAYPAYYAHIARRTRPARPLPGDVRHHCRDGVGLAPRPQVGAEAKGEGIAQTDGLELGRSAGPIDASIGSRTLSMALARCSGLGHFELLYK
jgi:hydroxyacylglutathione hydrolase